MDPELPWAPGRAHPGAPYPGTGVSSTPRSFGKSVSFLRAPWGRSRMGSDQRGQACSALSGRELVTAGGEGSRLGLGPEACV